MLEPELFALLEQTADAAYTVTENGEICSWNEAAEQLFGYVPSEVLGRNIETREHCAHGVGLERAPTSSSISSVGMSPVSGAN